MKIPFLEKNSQVKSFGTNCSKGKSGRGNDIDSGGGTNPIAEKLLKSLVGREQSAVISPSCLYQALALLSDMTSGSTQDELLLALGGEEEKAHTLSAVSAIDTPPYACPKFHYSAGASVWVSDSIGLNPEFELKASDSNSFAIEQVRLGSKVAKEKMGSWLAQNTGGKYATAPNVDSDVELVAMSAMHLKDSWDDPFEDDGVRPFKLEDGSSVRTPFMFDYAPFYVREQKGSTTYSKLLSSGARLVLSVPEEWRSLEEYVACGDAWQDVSFALTHGALGNRGEYNVHIPKFILASDGVDVAGLVRDLGIGEIFSAQADFSPVTPDPLMVSQILQNTRLEVDEEGIEGASYVAVMAVAGCFLPKEQPTPKEIFFDRPFVLAVVSPDGQPLFVGVVEKPEWK